MKAAAAAPLTAVEAAGAAGGTAVDRHGVLSKKQFCLFDGVNM